MWVCLFSFSLVVIARCDQHFSNLFPYEIFIMVFCSKTRKHSSTGPAAFGFEESYIYLLFSCSEINSTKGTVTISALPTRAPAPHGRTQAMALPQAHGSPEVKIPVAQSVIPACARHQIANSSLSWFKAISVSMIDVKPWIGIDHHCSLHWHSFIMTAQMPSIPI